MLKIDDEQFQFSEDYKIKVRNQWFRMGKIGAKRLLIALSADSEAKRKPSVFTLDSWIRNEFRPFAEQLDQQVNQEMNDRLVMEKVEMLMRHTETAKEMQNISLEWLRNNKDKLNAIAAARLLVTGVEIERMSLGIPKMLEKLADMKDEDLMKRIQDIVSRAPTEIQQLESSEDIIDEEFKDE